MTMQIDDTACHRDVTYLVAGISEGELFVPSLIDLKPVAACSTCWRGFQVNYMVVDSRLIASTLHTNLVEEFHDDFSRNMPPARNGITPRIPDRELELPADVDPFNTHYDQLNYPVEYTGGVLLARGFADGVHLDDMGFQPPWNYQTVRELIFRHGRLVCDEDRSFVMQEIRDDLKNVRCPQSSSRLNSIRSMGQCTFDRTYYLSFDC